MGRENTPEKNSINLENMPDVTTSTEEAVNESGLIQVLSPIGQLKILYALIEEGGEAVNPSTVYNRAGVSSDAWYRYHGNLEEYGLIEQTGNVGNSPLWRAKMEDPIVQRVAELILLTSDRLYAGDRSEEQDNE